MRWNGVDMAASFRGRAGARDLAIILAIFVVALVPRAYSAFFMAQHPSLHWDAAHDTVLARNLAAGHGFVNEPGHPTAYRMPLYPFILSVSFRMFGERYRPVLAFQALLGALTAAISAALARKAGSSAAMIAAGAMCALNPEAIRMTGVMLTETLFSFLVVASLLLLTECRGWAGPRGTACILMSGIVIGMSVLCRVNSIVWIAALVPFLLLEKSGGIPARRLLRILWLLAGVAIVLVPWMIRNQSVIGTPGLSTAGGRLFWDFRHNDAVRGDAGTRLPEAFVAANEAAALRDLAERGGDPAQMVPIFNLEPGYHAFFYDQETVDGFEGLGEAEADALFYRLGIDYSLRHPLRTALESIADAVRVFSPAERGGGINPVLMFALPLILLGLSRMRRSCPFQWTALLTALFSIVAVSGLVLYEARYRFPYEPLMFVASAAGMDSLVSGTGGGRRKVILLLAGLALTSAAAYLTLSGPVTS